MCFKMFFKRQWDPSETVVEQYGPARAQAVDEMDSGQLRLQGVK